MLTGDNGILTQAQRAKNETENAQIEENILSDYENYLSQYTNDGYVESKGVNAPVLKDRMELVTYNEETGEWETNNSSSVYDYVAGEETEDNNCFTYFSWCFNCDANRGKRNTNTSTKCKRRNGRSKNRRRK